MGPRPSGRGEPTTLEGRHVVRDAFNGATAQRRWRTSWGWAWSSTGCHRFNGATAQRPWRTAAFLRFRSRLSLLQWGHGPAAVENAKAGSASAEEKVASMGPRPSGRG